MPSDDTIIPCFAGIYCIENTRDAKKYIGQARNLRRRKQQHLYELRKGKHHSRHLQHAYDKEGETTFIFYVLELAPDYSESILSAWLIEHEQKWLDFYHSANQKFGYNICSASGTSAGIKRSPEFGQKISKTKTGTKRPPFSKEWLENMQLAQRRRKERSDEECAAISRGLKGHKVSEETKRKISIKATGRSCSPKNALAKCSRRYFVSCPNGTFYVVVSLNRFCKDMALSRVCLKDILIGKQKYHKGYTIRYMTEQEVEKYVSFLENEFYYTIPSIS